LEPGKIAVAIIQKYCDRLPEPSGGEDQVNRMISVDVARLHAQAACGGHKLNRLLPTRGELQLDPVICSTGAVRACLNACRIRPHVSVKIRYRKLAKSS
jgi:hypothetical protein